MRAEAALPSAKATESHGSLSMSPKVSMILGWTSATMELSSANRNVLDRMPATTSSHLKPVMDRPRGDDGCSVDGALVRLGGKHARWLRRPLCWLGEGEGENLLKLSPSRRAPFRPRPC